jgi:hypothetical protein
MGGSNEVGFRADRVKKSMSLLEEAANAIVPVTYMTQEIDQCLWVDDSAASYQTQVEEATDKVHLVTSKLHLQIGGYAQSLNEAAGTLSKTDSDVSNSLSSIEAMLVSLPTPAAPGTPAPTGDSGKPQW